MRVGFLSKLVFATAALIGYAVAQQAPQIYIVPVGGYNEGFGPDTPWPSANFALGSSSYGLSLATSNSALGGSITLQMSTDNVAGWRSIGELDIYVKGDPGTPFSLQWNCTGHGSGTNNSPGAYLVTIFYQGCGNPPPSFQVPVGQSVTKSASDGGTITGVTSGRTISNPAFPGVSYSLAVGFGHWIQIGANTCCGQFAGTGHADWTVNVTLISADCTLPDGIVNTGFGWKSPLIGDNNYTLGQFIISLIGSGDFSGRVIKERDGGGSQDACYFVGARVGPIRLGAGVWNVFAGNSISPPLDEFGLAEDQINTYRQDRQTNGLPVPCQIVLHQQMTISCPDGSFHDFGSINRLIYTIERDSVSVQRDGLNGSGIYESKRYVTP